MLYERRLGRCWMRGGAEALLLCLSGGRASLPAFGPVVATVHHSGFCPILSVLSWQRSITVASVLSFWAMALLNNGWCLGASGRRGWWVDICSSNGSTPASEIPPAWTNLTSHPAAPASEIPPVWTNCTSYPTALASEVPPTWTNLTSHPIAPASEIPPARMNFTSHPTAPASEVPPSWMSFLVRFRGLSNSECGWCS